MTIAMTRAFRTALSVGLMVVVGLTPLDLHIQATADGTWQHIKRQRGTKGGHTNYGHGRWCEEWAQDSRLAMPVDLVKDAQFCWKKSYRVSQQEVQNTNVMVFTDGSRMEGQAGSGWVIYIGGEVAREGYRYLGTLATVWQAEVTAITEAAV